MAQIQQTQKSTKADDPPKVFYDLLKTLMNALEGFFRISPPTVMVFVFILLSCFFVLFRLINFSYLYSLFVTLLFIFLSICLYIKEKNPLNAIFSFSLGIFTAFTVTWNGSTFSIFFISFIVLVMGLFLVAAIRLAANEEEIFNTAANLYIGEFKTNKKDLEEVYAIAKKQKGLLSIEKKQKAILFFAYLKVPKDRMVTLMEALNFLNNITGLDTEILQTLLKNINHLSDTEQDLIVNVETLKQYFLKGRSTPSSLAGMINDNFYIAIRQNADFDIFTSTILNCFASGSTDADTVKARLLLQLQTYDD